jgi:hypothetical protein
MFNNWINLKIRTKANGVLPVTWVKAGSRLLCITARNLEKIRKHLRNEQAKASLPCETRFHSPPVPGPPFLELAASMTYNLGELTPEK